MKHYIAFDYFPPFSPVHRIAVLIHSSFVDLVIVCIIVISVVVVAVGFLAAAAADDGFNNPILYVR